MAKKVTEPEVESRQKTLVLRREAGLANVEVLVDFATETVVLQAGLFQVVERLTGDVMVELPYVSEYHLKHSTKYLPFPKEPSK